MAVHPDDLKALGFTVEKGNPDETTISFYGSGAKAPGDHLGVEVGDPVEVQVADSKGSPMWVGGLVALSPVVRGASDGDYPGEDVMWVGHAEAYDAAKKAGGKPEGDEWPADGVRAVTDEKGIPDTKNPFINRDMSQPPVSPAPAQGQTPQAQMGLVNKTVDDDLVDITADFYQATEARDFHGRWTAGAAGGGGGAPSQGSYQLRGTPQTFPLTPQDPREGSPARADTGESTLIHDPVRKPTQAELGRIDSFLAEHHLTVEKMAQTLVEVAMRATPEDMKATAGWYQDAHDLATRWARDVYHTDTVRVAAVLASLSPQVGWGEERDASGKVISTTSDVANAKPNLNQALATGVLQEVFFHGDRQFTIGDDFVASVQYVSENTGKLTAPEVTPDPTSTSKSPKNVLINVASYNGKDIRFRGMDLRGVKRGDELPSDILAMVAHRDGAIHGMIPNLKNAIAAARGQDPDVILGGPKTRSFYNNIIFPKNSQDATMDVHMLRASTSAAPDLGINTPDKEAGELTGDTGAYQRLSEAMHLAAVQMHMAPHELQAVVWVQWRKEHPREEKRKITQAQGVDTKAATRARAAAKELKKKGGA